MRQRGYQGDGDLPQRTSRGGARYIGSSNFCATCVAELDIVAIDSACVASDALQVVEARDHIVDVGSGVRLTDIVVEGRTRRDIQLPGSYQYSEHPC